MSGIQKWLGFGQDGEAQRMQQERRREQQIRAGNLSARIRADFQPGRVDPAIGRTFGDAKARGLYDDGQRVGQYREQCARARRTREGFRWAQARTQGRRGRN